MISFTVKSHSREELIDITPQIRDFVSSSEKKQAVCLIYVPHTTAGITINENADPSVKRDLLMTLKHIVPDSLSYMHAEGNSPAHVKSTLVGSSASVIVSDGKPLLGTWQGIYFCEFDGPRERKVLVNIF